MGFIWELLQVLKRPFLDTYCPGPASCVCTISQVQSQSLGPKDSARKSVTVMELTQQGRSGHSGPGSGESRLSELRHTLTHGCRHPDRHPHAPTRLSPGCALTHPKPQTLLPVSETLRQWVLRGRPWGAKGQSVGLAPSPPEEFQIHEGLITHLQLQARRTIRAPQLHRIQRHAVRA